MPRQPLDPGLRQYLQQRQAATSPDGQVGYSAEQFRRRLSDALAARTDISGLPNRVIARDVRIDGALAARVYLPPDRPPPHPALLYCHGGGWVAGSIATHDPFCRLLCEAAAVVVASVDYRLAPENPFPAALEDVRSAHRWLLERAADFAVDPTRIGIGGDSAGAHLATVIANERGEEGRGPPLRAQLLLYPVTDYPDSPHGSYAVNAQGYGLTAEEMRWFWQQYIPPTADTNDPRVSPLRRALLPTLPPTLIATAEYDVLRDEGIAYSKRLVTSGVAVTHLHSADMNHNFAVTPGTVGRFPQCRTTAGQVATWLRRTLGLHTETLPA